MKTFSQYSQANESLIIAALGAALAGILGFSLVKLFNSVEDTYDGDEPSSEDIDTGKGLAAKLKDKFADALEQLRKLIGAKDTEGDWLDDLSAKHKNMAIDILKKLDILYKAMSDSGTQKQTSYMLNFRKSLGNSDIDSNEQIKQISQYYIKLVLAGRKGDDKTLKGFYDILNGDEGQALTYAAWCITTFELGQATKDNPAHQDSINKFLELGKSEYKYGNNK